MTPPDSTSPAAAAGQSPTNLKPWTTSDGQPWLIAGELAPLVGKAAKPLYEITADSAALVNASLSSASMIASTLDNVMNNLGLAAEVAPYVKALGELSKLKVMYRPVRDFADAQANDLEAEWKWKDELFSKKISTGTELAKFVLELKASADFMFKVDQKADTDDIPGTSMRLSVAGSFSASGDASADVSVVSLTGNASLSFSEGVEYGLQVLPKDESGVPLLVAMTATLYQIGFDVDNFAATQAAFRSVVTPVTVKQIKMDRALDLSVGGGLNLEVPFNVGTFTGYVSASFTSAKYAKLTVTPDDGDSGIKVDVDAMRSSTSKTAFGFGVSVGVSALGGTTLTKIKDGLGSLGTTLDKIHAVIEENSDLSGKLDELLPGKWVTEKILAKVDSTSELKDLLGKVIGIKPQDISSDAIEKALGGVIAEGVDATAGLFNGIKGSAAMAESVKAALTEVATKAVGSELDKLDGTLTEVHEELVSEVTDALGNLDSKVKQAISKYLDLPQLEADINKVLEFIDDVRGELKKIADYLSEQSAELFSLSYARSRQKDKSAKVLATLLVQDEQGAGDAYQSLITAPLKSVSAWIKETKPACVNFESGTLKEVRRTITTNNVAVGLLNLKLSSDTVIDQKLSLTYGIDGGLLITDDSKLSKTRSLLGSSRMFEVESAVSFARVKKGGATTASTLASDGLQFRIVFKDKDDLEPSEASKYLAPFVDLGIVEQEDVDQLVTLIKAAEASGKKGYAYSMLVAFDEAASDAICTTAAANPAKVRKVAAVEWASRSTALNRYLYHNNTSLKFSGKYWFQLTPAQQGAALLNVITKKFIKNQSEGYSLAKAASFRKDMTNIQSMPGKFASAFAVLGKLHQDDNATEEEIREATKDFIDDLKLWVNPQISIANRPKDVTVAFFATLAALAEEAGQKPPVAVLKYWGNKGGAAVVI